MSGLLTDRDIVCLTAPNPGPLTLGGTNTWVVARDPVWVIDPGPAIEEHVQRLCLAIERRGGLGGVVLTHDHADHAAAAGELLVRCGGPASPADGSSRVDATQRAGGGAQAGGGALVGGGALQAGGGALLAGARGDVDVLLTDGERVGPFCAVAAPGHSPDSYALIAHGACFSGDAVLGTGSVFVSPHAGAMAGYMGALQRLLERACEGDFDVICPGHGPVVKDARGKLGEYLDHRRERERALVEALEQGVRSERELLDVVWSDVPEQMRPAAGVTLAAHLDKLADEGLLPEGVERPAFEGVEW